MKDYILSVVTVCYNSEKTIERTLKSVKSEILKHIEDVEYVLIDGASDDKTMTYIHEYLDDTDIDTVIISEKDNGIYDAMNKAIKHAHGRFLIYINSDDVLKEGILEKVIPKLSVNKNIGCLCTDVEMVRVLDEHEYSYVWKVGRFDDLRKGMVSSHQGMYMNRICMDKLGGFDTDFKIVADWDMIYRISNKYPVKVMHEVSSDMYEGGASYKRQGIEKHKVRKKNGMYRLIDCYMFIDGWKNIKGRIATLIFGDEKKYRKTTLKKYIKRQ